MSVTQIIQQDTWTLIDDTGKHYDAFDWVIIPALLRNSPDTTPFFSHIAR